MKIKMTPTSKRKRARIYVYIQQKSCETFVYIYKKQDTLQKSRQFAICCDSQKYRHLTLHKF